MNAALPNRRRALMQRAASVAGCASLLVMSSIVPPGCDDARGGADKPAAQPASVSTSSAASSSTSGPDAALASSLYTLRFKIDGMTCQACVRAITREIQKHDTVQTCIVSLDDASALVVTRSRDDALLIPDAISRLGYKAVRQDGDDGSGAAEDDAPNGRTSRDKTSSESQSG